MSEKLSMAYAAANIFPLKFFLHHELIRKMNEERKVQPVHLQINPTNLCNFNCSFCSCSKRDKKLSLSIGRLQDLIEESADLGCQAATITGGGEPLLYEDHDRMLQLLADNNIKTGIVTNGAYIDRPKSWEHVTWSRISASDNLPVQLKKIKSCVGLWFSKINETVKNNGSVDWAFSYVLGESPNNKLIEQIVNFANVHSFTHVRIVSDIFLGEKLGSQMLNVQSYLKGKGIDCSRVIFQYRGFFSHGMNPCYISLLKPVIGADGGIYPCCGTQYALANPTRDYEKAMKMGEIEDFQSLYEEQKFFDGSICVKCFYENYNLVSKVMLEGIAHKEFL